jgi:DNA-binding transcriptional regulator YdaS (Cro superfamily)
VYWLAPVFRMLGGPCAVARMFGRDRSTVRQWATEQTPIPAAHARRLAELIWDFQNELTIVRADLLRRAKEGDQRAAAGMERRLDALGWAAFGRFQKGFQKRNAGR